MRRISYYFAAPFAAATLLATQVVCAEVLVSPDVPIVLSGEVLVNAMSTGFVEIARLSPGRQVKATLTFAGGTGDLSAAIVDEANLNFYKQGLPFRAHRVERQLSPITLEGKAWSHGQYYLLLDNRHAAWLGRNVTYRIDYMEKVDAAEQKELKQQFELLYAAIKEEFVFPDFNVHITPCGEANAFSAPDITMCTELLMEMVAKDRGNALAGIFLHELGHTLLNIWGMPGFDNEDIADEFAAVVMLSDDASDSGAVVLSDMITWFSEHNSKAQAMAILVAGDRHAPSIQRVRNLERIMENPAPVIERWNRLLYQHMTPKALERIASRPTANDDPQLARQILGLKGAETPVSP